MSEVFNQAAALLEDKAEFVLVLGAFPEMVDQRPLDEEPDGAKGAAALVLMLPASARKKGVGAYGVVRSWPEKTQAAHSHYNDRPLALNQTNQGDMETEIGLVVMAGLNAEEALQQNRLGGISPDDLSCAWVNLPPEVATGLGGALMSVVVAALSVSRRILPAANPSLRDGVEGLVELDRRFFTPTQGQTWFQGAGQAGRAAGVSLTMPGWAEERVAILEVSENRKNGANPLAAQDLLLFPVAANSVEEILDQLEGIKSRSTDKDLAALAQDLHRDSEYGSPHRYAAAILAQNEVGLRKEIEFALKGIPLAVEKGTDWQTPAGSCFSPNPQGQYGKVSLVFPGAFNSYVGVGRDLLMLFPTLYDVLEDITSDPGSILRERSLYPRSSTPLNKEEIDRLDSALKADAITMLASGTSLSVLHTHILQGVFDLQPEMAFGYSLGEISMMFASGAWGHADEVLARLEESPLFKSRLSGALNAVRASWGLPEVEPGVNTANIWENFLLMCPAEKVNHAIANEPRVYLTHINTPRQVVIGGDPEACKRVIAALNCSHLKAPFNYALHCSAMAGEYARLRELLSWPVKTAPELGLYTAAGYERVQFEPGQIAANMAHMLTSYLDFPQLIEQAYADGARIFIEVGAGSNCSKWIADTLGVRSHCAVSFDRVGTSDYAAVLRLLAKLFSQRVPLNLRPLFAHERSQA